MDINKIQLLIENLKNELESLEIFSKNLESSSAEHKDKKINQDAREKDLIKREDVARVTTKALVEREKLVSETESRSTKRQQKIFAEWKKMSDEREKLASMSEQTAKDILKNSNRGKELDDRELEADKIDRLYKKKAEALAKFNKQIEVKKTKTDEKLKRVEQYEAIE